MRLYNLAANVYVFITCNTHCLIDVHGTCVCDWSVCVCYRLLTAVSVQLVRPEKCEDRFGATTVTPVVSGTDLLRAALCLRQRLLHGARQPSDGQTV